MSAQIIIFPGVRRDAGACGGGSGEVIVFPGVRVLRSCRCDDCGKGFFGFPPRCDRCRQIEQQERA